MYDVKNGFFGVFFLIDIIYGWFCIFSCVGKFKMCCILYFFFNY